MLLDKLIPRELWVKLVTKGRWGWLGIAGLVVVVGVIEYCGTQVVTGVVHDAVTGCSESESSMTERANAVFSAIPERYGPPTRTERNGDKLVYESTRLADRTLGRFEVELEDSGDPCYWKIRIRAHVTDEEDEPRKLLATLDDFDVRRSYERRGFFFARDDGSIWLTTHESLRTTHASSFYWLDDYLDLADYWSRVWMPEVRAIAKGGAKPKQIFWRPGKDPESVIEGVEEFLRDAGVRR